MAMTTTIRLSQIIRTNKVWLVMMWSSSHLFLWVPKRDLGQDQDYFFFVEAKETRSAILFH